MNKLAAAIPASPGTTRKRENHGGHKGKSKLPEQQPGNQEGASKRSISLYATDLKRLDAIKGFMAERGVRNLSDSEALRLACRSVQPSQVLMSVYEEMKTEDRRRKQ